MQVVFSYFNRRAPCSSFFRLSVCSQPPPYPSSVPPCVALRPFIPPTNDASHPQTHQLTLFQSYRTSLYPPPSPPLSTPSFSCPGRVSRFTDLASRSKTRGLVSCRRITRSYLRQFLSLFPSSSSIHPPFSFSLSLSISLFLFLFS